MSGIIVFKFAFSFLCLLQFSTAAGEASEFLRKMEKSGIVPDVVDKLPTKTIKVTYPSGAKVSTGSELTPTQVKDTPSVTWEADSQDLYTLLLTDPDAPSRENPELREVRHWLVINIPGNKVSEGQTVFEYIGSGPPKDTGLHRYIFLAFKQNKKIEETVFVSNSTRNKRLSSKTRDLIKEYNLEGPIAGNYYLAQYDDYVPILHKQIGGESPTSN